jgi:hypothetical protein
MTAYNAVIFPLESATRAQNIKSDSQHLLPTHPKSLNILVPIARHRNPTHHGYQNLPPSFTSSRRYFGTNGFYPRPFSKCCVVCVQHRFWSGRLLYRLLSRSRILLPPGLRFAAACRERRRRRLDCNHARHPVPSRHRQQRLWPGRPCDGDQESRRFRQRHAPHDGIRRHILGPVRVGGVDVRRQQPKRGLYLHCSGLLLRFDLIFSLDDNRFNGFDLADYNHSGSGKVGGCIDGNGLGVGFQN